MNIREMRVLMDHRSVTVPMFMRFATVPIEIVLMLVVLVMRMAVAVLE